VAKKGMVGTITGVFDGALDGIAARLVRRRKFGYTVELLASKGPFQKGDIVHLSPAELLMQDKDPWTSPRGRSNPVRLQANDPCAYRRMVTLSRPGV
jgi:hypothetical protein